MALTWYTQPQGGFSSFYWYDATNLILVRIRLELNRSQTITNGLPKVIYNEDRIVGFSQTPGLNLAINPQGYLSFIRTSNNTPLRVVPNVGDSVYDASAPVQQGGPQRALNGNLHNGNPVTHTPLLPSGVSENMLLKLVDKALIFRQSFDLASINNDANALILGIYSRII